MAGNPKDKGHVMRARTRRMSYDDEPVRTGGNLFVWTIVILLLIGFALGCWIFSFYVFGHPEKAFSYSILTKLKKLEPLTRYELTAAPRGEFLTAKQLAERYGNMSDRELERASETLTRNYVRNYKLTQDLVPYVVGSYNILDSYELSDKNAFPSGVVALAQSTETPAVLLEHVFSANTRDVPTLHRMLLTGLDLKLDRGVDLSAIVNVKRLSDGRLQFTAVPLLYGSYASSTGPGVFSLEPPAKMNFAAGMPVLDEKAVAEATQKYAGYRTRAGLPAAGGSTAAKKPQPQLMRVERPKMADQSAAPPVPTATPLPDNLPVRAAIPVTASPTPAPDGMAGVNTETPQSTIAATAGGNWATFSPGQMPRGRLVTLADTDQFADHGVGADRVYLQGNFVVTAAGPNQAVLRMNAAVAESLGLGKSNQDVRVIVEYPAGTKPPAVGATFTRDSRRPFQITDIRKTSSGEVNVRAREVTKDQ